MILKGSLFAGLYRMETKPCGLLQDDEFTLYYFDCYCDAGHKRSGCSQIALENEKDIKVWALVMEEDDNIVIQMLQYGEKGYLSVEDTNSDSYVTSR